MMEWMNRWLGDPQADWREPELEIFSDEDLQVSPTGQVLTSYHSDRVTDLCVRRAEETLPKQRAAHSVAEASAFRDTLVECVLNRTGIKRPQEEISIEVVASEMHGNMQIRQAIIESEAEVFLPMLIGQSLASVPERLPVILADDRGKVANCSDGGLFHLLVEAGHPTVAVDLRGYGETQTTNWSNRDRQGGFVAQLLGVESMGYGYGARHTGHTLIGMRIFDLLQTIRALPHLGLSREVVLIGRGGCGIQALHAAVLSDAVTAVCTWAHAFLLYGCGSRFCLSRPVLRYGAECDDGLRFAPSIRCSGTASRGPCQCGR